MVYVCIVPLRRGDFGHTMARRSGRDVREQCGYRTGAWSGQEMLDEGRLGQPIYAIFPFLQFPIIIFFHFCAYQQWGESPRYGRAPT